jgi:hypothetical protein
MKKKRSSLHTGGPAAEDHPPNHSQDADDDDDNASVGPIWSLKTMLFSGIVLLVGVAVGHVVHQQYQYYQASGVTDSILEAFDRSESINTATPTTSTTSSSSKATKNARPGSSSSPTQAPSNKQATALFTREMLGQFEHQGDCSNVIISIFIDNIKNIVVVDILFWTKIILIHCDL